MGIADHVSAVVRVEVLRHVFLVIRSNVYFTFSPVRIRVLLACLFVQFISMDQTAVIDTVHPSRRNALRTRTFINRSLIYGLIMSGELLTLVEN